ncbi:uncharacterized protein LOC112345517 isoform X1 [Selaginella moellendorffii]|uniref:uncharacterized protein LOC112345517 isoform X1 n=1 Tax=Selaginella moellendorffii TaxID=88036 RepID=UPI000D1C9202|nr:uncharacterized protein LOC112345517 isoform X1 [Selaginella moellendorffii]|eukprot:XP_024528169.1 uncharacterized protein LOC112345517 isoform X1 [Selaginella moellendorffii]
MRWLLAIVLSLRTSTLLELPRSVKRDSPNLARRSASGIAAADIMDLPASPSKDCGSKKHVVEVFEPGSFEPSEHFYPRVLNAQIHPLVRSFMALGNDRIKKRYCHLHPEANHDAVARALSFSTRFFQWGGADLFSTTTEHGQKRFVVVETNSCPSGQKAMPLANEELEFAGYRTLLEKSLMPYIRAGSYNGHQLPEGRLAVLYDKNRMESSGYAATLAELAGEPVFLVPCYEDDPDPLMKCREDGIIMINTAKLLWRSREENGSGGGDKSLFVPEPVWEPVRAALRYVTQRPWSRIPPLTRTLVFNPILACLAGGRNKMLAAKAYDLHNAEIAASGLSILTPDTIWDVSKTEIPLWVRRMGGLAVVKIPYANAGIGVWTITHEGELQEFMGMDHRYDRFIVQALIGNHGWSSLNHGGRLYHVGTIPNLKGNIYAADLRLMVGSSPEGFFPVAIYARRARLPLSEKLERGMNSWDMLGTNLSVKNPDGTWGTETERLLLMDSRDFNRVGIGLDDLIEAYMQTVLAVTAIDGLACKLITSEGNFGLKLFQSLNPDPKLLAEMYPTELKPPLAASTMEQQSAECKENREDEEQPLQLVARQKPLPALAVF